MPTTQAKHLLNTVLSHKKQIKTLSEKYGFSNVRVFGSVARGDANYSSDIDILVDKNNVIGLLKIAEYHLALEDMFECKVDLLFSNHIDKTIQTNILEGDLIWVC